jgi:hypothetical protein
LDQFINLVPRENPLLAAFQQKLSSFFQFLGSVDGALQVLGCNTEP